VPVLTSLGLKGSDSPDSSIRSRKDWAVPDGRRHALRFPIRLPARCQTAGESGWGEILNISSRGALFTTDLGLCPNARAKVYIKWPVLLRNSVQLSLIVSGTIIRIEPGRAALAIENHEFRTCLPVLFQPSQSWRLPDRAPAGQSSKSQPEMVNLRCSQPKIAAERTLLRKRPTTQQRKVEVSDERWERVFQEKFADPEYYSSRRLLHSSPKVAL
jgi:hypothetical protein